MSNIKRNHFAGERNI